MKKNGNAIKYIAAYDCVYCAKGIFVYQTAQRRPCAGVTSQAGLRDGASSAGCCSTRFRIRFSITPNNGSPRWRRRGKGMRSSSAMRPSSIRNTSSMPLQAAFNTSVAMTMARARCASALTISGWPHSASSSAWAGSWRMFRCSAFRPPLRASRRLTESSSVALSLLFCERDWVLALARLYFCV